MSPWGVAELAQIFKSSVSRGVGWRAGWGGPLQGVVAMRLALAVAWVMELRGKAVAAGWWQRVQRVCRMGAMSRR